MHSANYRLNETLLLVITELVIFGKYRKETKFVSMPYEASTFCKN